MEYRFTDVLPTRISLLEKTRSGRDHRAWEELLGYYEPFITKILLRMGFRTVDAIATELDLRKDSVYVLRTRVKTRLRDEIRRVRIELEGVGHD